MAAAVAAAACWMVGGGEVRCRRGGDAGLPVWHGRLAAFRGAGAWEVGMKVTLCTMGLGGACMRAHTHTHSSHTDPNIGY